MISSQTARLETNKNNMIGDELIRIFYGGSLEASYDTGHASRTIYPHGRHLDCRARRLSFTSVKLRLQSLNSLRSPHPLFHHPPLCNLLGLFRPLLPLLHHFNRLLNHLFFPRFPVTFCLCTPVFLINRVDVPHMHVLEYEPWPVGRNGSEYLDVRCRVFCSLSGAVVGCLEGGLSGIFHFG